MAGARGPFRQRILQQSDQPPDDKQDARQYAEVAKPHGVSYEREEEGEEEGAEEGVADEGRQQRPLRVVEDEERPGHAQGDGGSPCGRKAFRVHEITHNRNRKGTYEVSLRRLKRG